MTDTVHFFFADLPPHVKGMTVKMFGDDGQDHFSVVLNSRLNWEQNKLSALHEMKHIEEGDFDLVNVDVDEIEYLRHYNAV